MNIVVKRAYEEPAETDEFRVLTDRLWPRGLRKKEAKVDLWLKDLGPSTELRKWFGHKPEKWSEFKRRYFKELEGKRDLLARIRAASAGRKITILFSAHDTEHNNAVALLEYLERHVEKRVA